MASKFQIPIAFKSDPRGLKEAEGALAGFGKKLAGIGAAVAGAFAVRAVFNFGKEAILAAEQVSTANNTLIAVAKATNAFGAETDKVTGKLIKFAKAQEMRIGVDENVVKSVQAQLLSFKAVGASAGDAGGAFERATKAAFDMAVVLKKDAGSQAIALGKALEDPIRGITALRRGGTTFTQQQQEQIKVMVESNDILGAQNLILAEVESQYGGAAEASANWSDKLTLAFGNIKESLGAALTPAFERFAKYLIEEVIPPVTAFFDNDFPVMLQKFGAMADGLTEALAPIGQALREAFNIPDNVSLLESLLDSIARLPDNKLFKELVNAVVLLVPSLLELIPPLTEMVIELVPLLIALLPALIWFIELLAYVFGKEGLSGAIDAVVESQAGWVDSVENLKAAGAAIERVVQRLTNFYQGLNKAIRDAIKSALEFFRVEGNRIPGVPMLNAPKRAVGGPVSARETYLVGERGPELFTPGAGGFITPNNRLGGGGSAPVYNITVNAGMGANGAQLGEAIVSAIKRYERASGPVFASA
jgi:hypothetical protein